MAFFRGKDPEKILAKSHEKMVAKFTAEGSSWIAALSNELASSRPGYTSLETTPAQNRVVAAAGDRYVLEEAQGLYRDRPTSRRDRRSVQPDADPVRQAGRNVYQPERLVAIGGIFSARRADVGGRIPVERWPSETQPRGGCSLPNCTCGR